MNKIARLLILITLLLPAMTYAQQVTQETIKKGSDRMPGYTLKLKHGKKVTKQTMEETLALAGIKKAKHKKGYSIYRGVTWAAISPSKLDYYYKVKGNKRKATVYFAASKGYDNYVTPANDAAIASNINTALTDLNNKVDIKEQLIQKQGELDKLNKSAEQTAKDKAQKEQEIDKLKTKGK